MEQITLWLLIASIGLTLLVNVLLIAFPKAFARLENQLKHVTDTARRDTDEADALPVRFIAPWQAVLIALLGTTMALNLGTVIAA